MIAVLVAITVLSGDSMCIIRRITGLPCPTCGMTRAGLSLLYLDFSGAFDYHPLIFFVVPALFIGFLTVTTGKASKEKLKPWIIGSAVLIFTVYVIRMILFFPDREPMVFDENSLAGFILRLFSRK